MLSASAAKAPIDQSISKLQMRLFRVNTATGKIIALSEQRWNGKYSKGVPHLTRLKMIAAMPEKDSMPRMIICVLRDLPLSIKYRPTIMPAPKIREIICVKVKVPQTIVFSPLCFSRRIIVSQNFKNFNTKIKK